MNEQDFYPKGAGAPRGSILVYPDDLPRFAESSQARLAAFVLDDQKVDILSSTFFNALNRGGAVASIDAANVWKTVVNVAGGGFLGNVVAPHCDGQAATIEIRVTADGVQWTWEETFAANNNGPHLMVLGALNPLMPGSIGFASDDRVSESAGAIPTATLASSASQWALVPTTALMAMGRPVLAFEASLLVEVRSSVLDSTAGGHTAGCTFVTR